MERYFSSELKEVKEELRIMGELAKEMIHKAITALVKRDKDLTPEIQESEKR
jgi:phosphate uptake regulator